MLALGWGSPVMAGAAVPATCDPAFKNAMDARAWMGGKRDMESATSIIVRNPNDSILDMSCFDRNIAEFATKNASLFSDGHQRYVATGADYGKLFRQPPLCFGPGCVCYANLTECVGVQGPTDTYQPTFTPALGPDPPGAAYTNVSLDNSFINLVRLAMRQYLGPNFRDGAAPAATICSDMSNLWQTVKCTDINKGGWITLAAHVGTDRRPTAYGACNDRGVWSQRHAIANPAPGAAGAVNALIPYRTTIYTVACNSIRPVPTGLLIQGANGGFQPDAVCPGVGCYYNRQANSCN